MSTSDRDRYALLRRRVAEWKIHQHVVREAILEEHKDLDETRFDQAELDLNDATRPHIRAECAPGGEKHYRPCPWAMCRYNMFDMLMSTVASRQGPHVLRVNDSAEKPKPILSPLDVRPDISCMLDIVDRNPNGCTLDAIGDILGLTRERVRQIHVVAIRKMLVRLRATPSGRELAKRIITSLDLEEDPEVQRMAFDPDYEIPLPIF